MIAPKPLTIVEISFDHHEYYAGDELVGSISHDDNLTQPWVVMINGTEKFRANTWARCNRFIEWHHQDGTLNEPGLLQSAWGQFASFKLNREMADQRISGWNTGVC
ncbi:hypothetical protein LC608_28445 [Nostoc sp. XA010]|uniref:hypothetical protein n=1 Tax=Nostoc sp. XA010 TaxID=2780407 RepID=UPI001E44ABDD|nr:hypothetical protein [Nostoc sp. XA010]MCC5660834.1 hypothetical protein [Nostoc sp. XA010]